MAVDDGGHDGAGLLGREVLVIDEGFEDGLEVESGGHVGAPFRGLRWYMICGKLSGEWCGMQLKRFNGA